VVPNLFHIVKQMLTFYTFFFLSFWSSTILALIHDAWFTKMHPNLDPTNTHAPPTTAITVTNLFYWSHVLFVFVCTYVYVLPGPSIIFILLFIVFTCVQTSRPSPPAVGAYVFDRRFCIASMYHKDISVASL
jgi:hypothetical protein